MDHRAKSIWVAAAAMAIAGLGGCADRKAIETGYAELNARNYSAALNSADAQLAKTPSGQRAAEAWYLRGRTLEGWPAATTAVANGNMGGARQAYERGLACDPDGKLRAYLRASLGNVAFFQEDYPLAAKMSLLAYGELDDASPEAWTLYRAAVSQQRLGQFAAADHNFDLVAEKYPGTLQARRAEESRGARAFYLRMGAFTTSLRAEAASDGLRRQGFAGLSIYRDTRGVYLLRVGPYATYARAKAAKRAVAGSYPDALVMP